MEINLKESDERLLEKLREVVLNNYKDDLIDLYFKLDDTDYSLVELRTDNWDDEGKYQYKTFGYQLVSYDKNIKTYPCGDSIINYYDLYVEQDVIRSGSYYSDYYYQYEKPHIKKACIKTVPEVVIPAHEELVYEYIY